MRVKITSTCNLDEASSVVVDILTHAQEELRALSNQKFNYWQVSELLLQISSLREAIANIDHNLDDATSIASGWLDTVIAEHTRTEVPDDVEREEEIVDEQKE